MNALLLFTKNPELGHVKTRLAATIGPERALEVYLYLMQHTRELALSLPVERWLFYSQSIPAHDAWPDHAFQKYLQDPSPDLGKKMYRAFSQALDAGFDKAMIIGSDCFEITPELLTQAYMALDHVPVVLGPATDGGYYGLGVNFKSGIGLAQLATFFLGKSWSHERVAVEAREAFQDWNLPWTELPTLSDVDVEDDIAPIRAKFHWA